MLGDNGGQLYGVFSAHEVILLYIRVWVRQAYNNILTIPGVFGNGFPVGAGEKVASGPAKGPVFEK
jgi:hypothetical protein